MMEEEIDENLPTTEERLEKIMFYVFGITIMIFSILLMLIYFKIGVTDVIPIIMPREPKEE